MELIVMGLKLHAQGPADLAMGIIAFIVSLAAFLHPVQTFWNVRKMGKAGGLEPYPYMAAINNCFSLYLYSLRERPALSEFRDGCLFCSSAIGLLITGTYISMFWNYNTEIKIREKCAIGIMYLMIYLVYYKIPAVQERLLGPIAMVSEITMYMSPFFPLVRAYRTKCVECLPFWMCTTFGLYALAWTTYAFLPPAFESYFLIGNGIGTILSVFQLGICYALLVKFQSDYAGESRNGVDEPLLC